MITGLLVLSCAPHQEPRFLLPVIVPLVFLFGRQVVGLDKGGNKTNKRLAIPKTILSSPVFWDIFNSILYTFFGWLHQGGLIDSLLHLGSDDQSQRVAIYYKTYIPPTFLTRRRLSIERNEGTCKVNEEETCRDDFEDQNEVIILDLQGEESSVLLDAIRQWMPCPSADDINEKANFNNVGGNFLHLYSPPAAMLPLLREQNWEEYTITSTTKDYHPHISTEDWPVIDGSISQFMGQLRLSQYSVSCH